MEFTIQTTAKRGDFPWFFVCFAEAKSMAVAQAQANKHGLYPWAQEDDSLGVGG